MKKLIALLLALSMTQVLSASEKEWHTEYHNFEDTQDFFEDTCLDNEDDICHWIEALPPNYQTTWLGEKVVAVALSTSEGYNPNNPDAKPTVVVQFQQQAREWIASASAMYVFEKLLNAYSSGDPAIIELLDHANLILLPLINPDGHHLSWQNDRLWRKNHRYNSDGSIGVNLNCNWNVMWGGIGCSQTPSSDLYFGPAAESEPEVHAVASFYRNIPNLVGFMDVGSYGQQVLRPYAFTPDNAPDEAYLKVLGDEIATVMSNVNGYTYTSMKWSQGASLSTGVAQDYMYNHFRIPSYTIKLRPKDEAGGGYILPPEEIIPTGEELYAGILLFANEVTYSTRLHPISQNVRKFRSSAE